MNNDAYSRAGQHGLAVPCGLLLLAAVTAVGCGKTGTIEGRVMVDGTPAFDSGVLVCDGTGWSALGTVRKDGRYRADGIPVGPVTAVIIPPPPIPTFKYPYEIPRRYEQHDSSGLQWEVRRGRNVFDILITAKE